MYIYTFGAYINELTTIMIKARQILIIFLIIGSLNQLFAQDKEQKKLVKKINKANISNIHVVFPDSFRTNQAIDISIFAMQGKKTIISEGIVNNLCFDLESMDASFNNKGQLVVHQNSKYPNTDEIPFSIVYKKDRKIKCDTNIRLNYQGLLIVDYSQRNGKKGLNGEDGLSGVDGLNGEDGLKGEDGRDIEVLVRIEERITSNKLLCLKVMDLKEKSIRYYLSDP